MKDLVIQQLKARKIEVEELGELVLKLQEKHCPDLSMEMCLEAIEAVLEKREVQNAIFTGLALDIMAEQNLLPSPIQDIIARDEPLYGIDEVIGMAITNIYGTIGITSFGYLDKEKLGLVGRLDADEEHVNTFADDLVAAIVAAAAAKIAHSIK